MEHIDCMKSFNAYSSSAKQIDELADFYSWCKDVGAAKSYEFLVVQRISSTLLRTLEEFMKDRGIRKTTFWLSDLDPTSKFTTSIYMSAFLGYYCKGESKVKLPTDLELTIGFCFIFVYVGLTNSMVLYITFSYSNSISH